MIWIFVFLVASSIGIGEKKLHARVTRKVCFLVGAETIKFAETRVVIISQPYTNITCST